MSPDTKGRSLLRTSDLTCHYLHSLTMLTCLSLHTSNDFLFIFLKPEMWSEPLYTNQREKFYSFLENFSVTVLFCFFLFLNRYRIQFLESFEKGIFTSVFLNIYYANCYKQSHMLCFTFALHFRSILFINLVSSPEQNIFLENTTYFRCSCLG